MNWLCSFEICRFIARKEANGLGIDVESVRQRRKDLVRLGNRALNVLQVWNGSAFEVFNDIPTAIGGAMEEGLLLKIEELKRRYRDFCFIRKLALFCFCLSI